MKKDGYFSKKATKSTLLQHAANHSPKDTPSPSGHLPADYDKGTQSSVPITSQLTNISPNNNLLIIKNNFSSLKNTYPQVLMDTYSRPIGEIVAQLQHTDQPK